MAIKRAAESPFAPACDMATKELAKGNCIVVPKDPRYGGPQAGTWTLRLELVRTHTHTHAHARPQPSHLLKNLGAV